MIQLLYFDWSEFDCRCGCGRNEVKEASARRLDRARGLAGIPFVVTSAYRCPEHNAAIGSTSDVHPRGHAFDISTTDSRSRFLIFDAMRRAGFNRMGQGRDFVHCDDDPSKAPNVQWGYYS